MADIQMPIPNTAGASGVERDTYFPAPEIRFGEGPTPTTNHTVTVAGPVDYPFLTPVAISAAGALTLATPGGANNFGLLAVPLKMDAAGTTSVAVYRGGHFSTAAVPWPAAFTTLALKRATFQTGHSPTILLSEPPHNSAHTLFR